jgi:Uma2 family endonuclease
MNEPLRSPQISRTTQAAEGLSRWRWTVAEIEAMTRAGIIGEDERFELIGGEIVPMSAKGIFHEVLKTALVIDLARKLPKGYLFTPETTFYLSEDSFVEPDIVFYREADGLEDLSPRTALLAIELSDSSLGWDLGRKARIYANFGIPELWVVEAKSRITHVHRRPGLEGYLDIRQVGGDEPLSTDLVPGLTVTIGRFGKPRRKRRPMPKP